MSANNQVFIIKHKEKYRVYECCADEVSRSKNTLKKYGCGFCDVYDTLEEAMSNQPNTEYGATFIGEE